MDNLFVILENGSDWYYDEIEGHSYEVDIVTPRGYCHTIEAALEYCARDKSIFTFEKIPCLD